MKRLFLVLLLQIGTFGFSQKTTASADTKIVAYRLLNRHYWGSCDLYNYLATDMISPEPETLQVREIFDCNDLIKKLLEVKKTSRSWKSKTYHCEGICGPCDMPNILIVMKHDNVDDRIFLRDGLDAVDFPDEHKFFIDENHLVKSEIYKSPVLKELFETDFYKIYDDIFGSEIEAVADEFRLGGKYVTGMGKVDIELILGKLQQDESPNPNYTSQMYRRYFAADSTQFVFFSSDTISPVAKRKDYLQNVWLKSVTSTDPTQSGFDVFGLRIGDDQQKVIDHFPAYASRLLYAEKYYKNRNDGSYFIIIYFSDQGSISIYLQERKITDFYISLGYPDDQ